MQGYEGSHLSPICQTASVIVVQKLSLYYSEIL